MALHKQLTKGRESSLTVAACIYMTCRIEGTPHLLIDFSDVLQMDVYALGRAYVQISRALYINIPAVDPCMYILRFAHKFELGEKTHEVAMTALRLVQRMKRDWIHLGRRPSGICGAALLISARLHKFSRSVQDVIRVVKVHETTLRKRLVEFGETPSSSLTVDEFMSVDLEEEHDPPSFKAAQIKDRERLQKLLDDENGEDFKAIQSKIDEELDKRRRKVLSRAQQGGSPLPRAETPDSDSSVCIVKESHDAKRFIIESTLSTINTLVTSDEDSKKPLIKSNTSRINVGEEHTSGEGDIDRMLMPPPLSSTCVTANNELDEFIVPYLQDNDDEQQIAADSLEDGELDLYGIDDDEINGYIMNSQEIRKKTALWEKLNADYILLQKEKEEQIEKDIKEGKVNKQKKKKNIKPKPTFQARSADEAIKIMLKERKISSKINYDVLRSLTSGADQGEEEGSGEADVDEPVTVMESGPIIPPGRGENKRKIEEQTENPVASSSKKSKSSRARQQSFDERAEAVDPSASTETAESIEDSDLDAEKQEDDDDAIVESRPVQFTDTQDVIVESGPVQPVGEDVVVESGEVAYVEDDDSEEEDNESLSASRLLTQFRGAIEEENDYDDYYD